MLNLIVDIAATYRVTKLVLDDEIVREIREAVWAKFPPESTKIGFLISCPWCTSFWAGVAVFTLRKFAPKTLADIVNGSLAASALTGLAYERL